MGQGAQHGRHPIHAYIVADHDPSKLHNFDWASLGMDDGGMPIHLPIGVTVDRRGPADGTDELHHYECWCGHECALAHELRLAYGGRLSRKQPTALHKLWAVKYRATRRPTRSESGFES